MRKGEQTRDMIVKRAAGLLNRKGYYASSLSEIMEATGLQKGGIYNHFESKEELAFEAFRYCVGQLTESFERAIGRYNHAVDQLIAMMSSACDLVRDIPLPGGCPIMNAAIESDNARPDLRELARKTMEGLIARAQGIVERGISRGEIRAGVDGREVALLVVSMMEGAIMLSRLTESDRPIDAAVRHMVDYLNAEVRVPC